jgi:hypothetical protein
MAWLRALILFCWWTTLPTPAAGLSVEDWRSDLRFLIEQIEQVHPAPFAKVSEAELNEKVAQLEARLAGLSDEAIAVELMRLTALLSDGHTGILDIRWPAFDAIYPLRVGVFEDGMFVQAASPELAHLLGAKVRKIGSLEAREALVRVLAIANGDNEWSRLDRAPRLLVTAPIAYALGLTTTQDELTFEVERNGSVERVTVKARAAEGSPFEWFFQSEGLPFEHVALARDGATALPLYLRRRERAYWFEYLPVQKLLWLQFNRVDAVDQNETFAALIERFFETADNNPVARVVIDLRFNHGGNNQILKPLLHGLIRRPQLDRRGQLFTIIGRGTFSAAVNFAALLAEHTQTLFVGEPSGAPANHYGEPTRIELPRSKIVVSISRHAWQGALPWDRRTAIHPDLPAAPNFGAYRENRDPALEAILRLEVEALLDRLKE